MNASRCDGPWGAEPPHLSHDHAGPGSKKVAMSPATIRLFAVILLVFVACSVTVGVARSQPLIIATEPQVTAAPLIIADQRGWFAEEGLDVRFVHFHANRTMVMALAEGDVDVALVDLSAEAFSMAAENQLRIIAAAEQLNRDFPRYAWLIASEFAPSGLAGLAERDDAVIGLNEAGSPARYLINRRIANLAADVGFVSQGSDVALAAALVQGDVDAALLPAYLAADLEATGAATVSAWAGSMEGPVSLSVLMTTAAQARLRPDVMEKFLRAYVRGLRAYHDAILAPPAGDDVDENESPTDSIAAAQRAALFGIVADGARRPIEEVLAAPPYMAIDGQVDERSLRTQLAWWKEEGECAEEVDLQDLLELGSLHAALLALAESDLSDSAESPSMQVTADEPLRDPAPARDPTAAGGP